MKTIGTVILIFVFFIIVYIILKMTNSWNLVFSDFKTLFSSIGK